MGHGYEVVAMKKGAATKHLNQTKYKMYSINKLLPANWLVGTKIKLPAAAPTIA